MNKNLKTYTYVVGKKVDLEKRPDQFVARALPDKLRDVGVIDAEQTSSASSKVTCRIADLEPLMSSARHIAPTHHAYYIADTDEEFLITDRIFITFRDPLPPDQVDIFAGRYGLFMKRKYSDREYLFQLTDHTGMNPVKLVVKLTEEEPLVESAEHDLNYRAQICQLPLPTDPFYAQEWHLHTRYDHPEYDLRSSTRAEEAWQILGHFGSKDVVIGVTDDGCRLNHLDFNSPRKFAGWGYFRGERLITNTDIDANSNRMYQFGSNHGTSCAGVIAGEVDAVLCVGAAPGCRLLPIKWESAGPSLYISPSKFLDVLDFVAEKVDILSNSWGSAPSNLWPPIVTSRIAELAKTGGRRGCGIICIWAAGNENCPIRHIASVDVPYSNGWGQYGWVGVKTAREFENSLVGIPGVMHVAALASTAKRSHYSNYGTGITLCAPTSNSHTYRRMDVQGLGITTATGPSDVTERFGGTSSAAPLVAGIAALVVSANPELTALEVISILKKTASKDLNFEGYPRTSPASFDPDTSWDVSPIDPFDNGDFQDIDDPDGTWSPWFGTGRVDAPAAVAEALKQPGPDLLQYQLNPEVDIPDNDPAGIEDIINVPDSGQLRDIRVKVDITHTYIGDLKVSLIAPDGTTVLLHNRTGSSRNNIRETYDYTSTPALATLKDQSITGEWILKVEDRASQDVGILQSWELEIGISPVPLVAEDIESVQIPDNDPNGITRSLSLTSERVIRNISVFVDITHPGIDDLQVSLTPPGRSPILLHDRERGSADNIVRTWRSQEFPGLMTLRDSKATGTWQLRVADLAGRNVGKLNRWRIEVEV